MPTITGRARLASAPPSTELTVSSRGKGGLKLSWTDRASNESEFRIERRTGDGSYAQVASVGPNATSYTDGGLARRTTYTYRVRAHNAAGDSGYSNKASGTTK